MFREPLFAFPQPVQSIPGLTATCSTVLPLGFPPSQSLSASLAGRFVTGLKACLDDR